MSEFHSGHHRYVRLVFGVYWQGTPPSFEEFYALPTEGPRTLALTPTFIQELTDKIVALINQNDQTTRALGAKFLAQEPVHLSREDISSFGWKLLPVEVEVPARL